MLSTAANALKKIIKDLPFVETIAGMTFVGSRVISEGNRQISCTFPVACGVDDQNCFQVGHFEPIRPSVNKKSIIYFEDNGGMRPARGKNLAKGTIAFTGSMRLVAWLNYAKMGLSIEDIKTCSSSSVFAVNVITAIECGPKQCIVEEGCYSGSIIQLGTPILLPKNTTIFSKYTAYKQDTIRCLGYPMDYFAIDIPVTFLLNKKCFAPPVLGEPIDCIVI